MPRAVLLVAGVGWLIAALAGLAVALFGLDRLLGILPPLAIDDEAVGRSIVALSIAAAAFGLAHLVVAAGIRGERAWAVNAGILLAAGAGMLSLALGAAALTSAAAGTMDVVAAVGGGIAALLAAVAYGLAVAALVHRLRLGGLR